MTDTDGAGIVGVTTIGIPVADQDRALAFYRDVLGFGVLVDAPLPQTGGRWIMLAPPGSPVSVSLVSATDSAPAGVETGIRFETLDAERTYATLRGAESGCGGPAAVDRCSSDVRRLRPRRQSLRGGRAAGTLTESVAMPLG